MAKPLPHFAKLDAGEIIATADQLASRIDERFHGFGLSRVAATLVELAGSTEAEVLLLTKPNVPIRIAAAAVLIAGVLSLVLVASLIGVGHLEGGAQPSLQRRFSVSGAAPTLAFKVARDSC